jgi:transcriptional regulator with XRE-family HTH domain
MSQRESTAATRELGAELLRRREAAGLLGADLARKTGWSPTKICRLETGLGSYSEVTVTAYLAHCGVPAPEIAAVLKAADHQQNGYLARRDVLRNLVMHESTASRVQVNATGLVPGLLQTEDYARAVARVGGDLPSEEIDRRVEVRMDRQRLLRQWRRPSMRFFIGENVLRTVLGGKQVMHEQLLHLLFAADRPTTQIRIVRSDASATAAVTGYFTLMDFPQQAPVIFIDGSLVSTIVEDPDALMTAQWAADKISADALDERESRELLVRMASDYD